MFKFSQKGVSLYIAVIILAIILAGVLGLSTILVGQIRAIRGIGYSVVALYAADTGIEQALCDVYEYFNSKTAPPSSYPSTSLDNEAEYKVEVVCCDSSNSNCSLRGENPCPTGTDLIEDPDCPASFFCIRSVGTYKEAKRAIEVQM